MASATPVGTFAYADIITCPTIVPKNVLAMLRRSPLGLNGDIDTPVVAWTTAKIDKDRWLSDQQKEDLRNLIKLSPHPEYTAQVMGTWVMALADLHRQLSIGFQFFIDGGRGKAEMDSEKPAVDTPTRPQNPIGPPPVEEVSSQPPTPGHGNSSGAGTFVAPTADADTSRNKEKTATQAGAADLPIASGFSIAHLGTPFQPSPGRAGNSTSQSQHPTVGDKRNASNSMLPTPKRRKLPHSFSAASVASTAASTKPKRDPFFADKLKTRSGERCELTGVTSAHGFIPEGAHIFGLATASDERAGHFWKLLYMFWDARVVDELRDACQKQINHMANGIFMNILPHRLWDQFEFYFEVVDGSYQVSGNKAQYTIKMRFLKRVVDLINYSRPLRHLADGTRIPYLIEDGDEFIFKTDNYHDCPLPDPNLLKIRALLTKCCFLKNDGAQAGPAVSGVQADPTAEAVNGVVEDTANGVLEDTANGVLEDTANGVFEDTADGIVESKNPELPQQQGSGDLRARVRDYGEYSYPDDESTEDGSLVEEDSAGYLDDEEFETDTPDDILLVEAWLYKDDNLVEGDVNEEG